MKKITMRLSKKKAGAKIQITNKLQIQNYKPKGLANQITTTYYLLPTTYYLLLTTYYLLLTTYFPPGAGGIKWITMYIIVW